MILKALFDKLNDHEFSRYTENGIYAIEEDNIIELKPKELLEIRRTYPCKENVMIAYFDEDVTRILYFGEDIKSMKKTLSDLRLPSYPSNLGETVFKIIKQNLEKYSLQNNSLALEQKVFSGLEHQFELVLKKFIHIYRGLKIDSEFYKNFKSNF